MEEKFKKGEIVFARIAPKTKLVVEDYKDRIYYCSLDDEPKKKHLVYFERELVGEFAKTITYKKD